MKQPTIIRRPGKVTKKFIENLNNQVLFNVVNHNPDYRVASDFWYGYLEQSLWEPIKKENVRSWGKPNINMMSYESAPGVWIFDDTVTGIVWYIWSDLHHKNPWKGTSFELHIPPTVTGPEMLDALKRFVEFIKIS